MKDEPVSVTIRVWNYFPVGSNHLLNIVHLSTPHDIKPKKFLEFTLGDQEELIITVTSMGNEMDVYIQLPVVTDLTFLLEGKNQVTFSRTPKDQYCKIHAGHDSSWKLKIVKPSGQDWSGYPADTVSIGNDPPGISD